MDTSSKLLSIYDTVLSIYLYDTEHVSRPRDTVVRAAVYGGFMIFMSRVQIPLWDMGADPSEETV
jgi:hypothetical protein